MGGTFSGLVNMGLGISSFVKQGQAAEAQKASFAIDKINAESAAKLEYEKLDITIEQLTRAAGVVVGEASAAIAGAGAEVGGAISAQARAVTFAGLARDIDVLRLNTQVAVTQLGLGEGTKLGNKLRAVSRGPQAGFESFDFAGNSKRAFLADQAKRDKESAEASE